MTTFLNEQADDLQNPGDAVDQGGEGQLLSSVHTPSFPQILAELNSSLLVSTYQAGKLVMLRNQQGVLNTHFRQFQRPMGMAVDGGRLAVGTTTTIQEFHNVPAASRRIESTEKPDALFLPRRENVTGDVAIHEMAWVPGPSEPGNPSHGSPELWFLNTAFSCLAVRSEAYSFEPRWRPKFVSEYAPDDRCHLNGLAVVNGRVKFVTALGETDTAGGWRVNKRNGGILIDIDSDEVIARGLSMPHSPRWYDGKLWILNSGTGGFGTINLETGRYEEIVQLDGFPRGLCFAGPLAFIGLSQVRESSTFNNIPLVERLQRTNERNCGVWVVNIHTGQTLGMVRFEEGVQEIFAVELLRGMAMPDLVHDDSALIASSYVLPDDALVDVPAQLRTN